MYLNDGWQQIVFDEGVKDFRRAYKNKAGITIFTIRLWQTLDRWSIEICCNPLVKGIATNHPVTLWHTPVSTDEVSMRREAEDVAREFFTRLNELFVSAIQSMD